MSYGYDVNFSQKYEAKTFKPRKKFNNPKRDKFSTQIIKTLGFSLTDAVKIPNDGTCRNEWLVVNCNVCVYFYNQMNLLHGCLSEICTVETCPTMSAGGRYEFLWKSEEKKGKPYRVPAPIYIQNTLDWVSKLFDDENCFSTSNEFPLNFEKKILQKIFKRYFRFYAHIYHSHLKELEYMNEDRHFNTCFKHFIMFSMEFSLIDDKELEPLSSIVSKFCFENQT
ncbi:hypothetical protein HDU92_005014 [Lobulomyces angularis]|nr:hypothetical protein HDU92_005014 [Lobulomyces angularis]